MAETPHHAGLVDQIAPGRADPVTALFNSGISANAAPAFTIGGSATTQRGSPSAGEAKLGSAHWRGTPSRPERPNRSWNAVVRDLVSFAPTACQPRGR